MKILCIGHAAYDITMPYEGFPKENTKNRIEHLVECGGGPASNAAYLLAKWGMDTAFMGVVGNDLYGNRIKQEFIDANVDISNLEVHNDTKTTSSFIIANSVSGTRTIFTHRGNMKLKSHELSYVPDIILTDGQEYEASVELIKKYKDAITVIDAGRPRKEIIELASMCNYLVCSKEFAESVAGMTIDVNNNDNIAKLYNKLEEKFHNNIVITLENRGCVYKLDGLVKVMPSLVVNAVDSTGAGDIFHGAFVYGLANNYSYEDIMRISNIAGAISVTKIGGRFSVPTKEEMREQFNEFK
jgi:sugar/nucleoside kinase (ribokinase family)